MASASTQSAAKRTPNRWPSALVMEPIARAMQSVAAGKKAYLRLRSARVGCDSRGCQSIKEGVEWIIGDDLAAEAAIVNALLLLQQKFHRGAAIAQGKGQVVEAGFGVASRGICAKPLAFPKAAGRNKCWRSLRRGRAGSGRGRARCRGRRFASSAR